jgi:archaellin
LSSGATAVTKLNGTVFTGSTVTWTADTDTLTIEVTPSVGAKKTYTVTVTHTP